MIERHHYPLPLIEYLPESVDLLRACVRPGSWFSDYKLLQRRLEYKWFPGDVPYFKDLADLTLCGGVPSVNSESEILTSDEVIVNFQQLPPNSFPRNSFTLIKVEESTRRPTKEFEYGFILDIQGSESFQHFMIDLMPAIGEITDFLSLNAEIPIFVRHPKFDSQETIFRDFGVKNEIIRTNPGDQIFLKHAYWQQFSPIDFTSTVPLESYTKFSNLYSKRKKRGKHLTLIVRREQTRNWLELESLKNLLLVWCKKNGLRLEILNTDLSSFEGKRSLFRESEFVLAIHGGANYHSVYMPKSSFFIEVVPVVETETILRYCVGTGINYAVLPVEGAKSDYALQVDILSLESLLNQCKRKLSSELSY
jgi:capsular polysaccharide biosynthesis protein